MAAAYASLLSLGHILDHLLQHPPRHMAVLDKSQIDSLLQSITFLQEFLEEFPLTRREEIQELEEKMARSAYAAEDVIESLVLDQILEDSKAGSERSSSTLFCQDLQRVIEEFDSMKKDAMMINETEGITIMEQPRQSGTAGSFIQGASDGKNTMVGFDEDLIQIMDTLIGDESNLQILPIVGMGGIGKTTLAKNVFEHPLIVQHFDLHAWVTISQQYSVREILLGLLKDVGVLAGESEEITQEHDDELGLRVHKSLFDRRYFIVMDDIWIIEVWDGIRRFLPENSNGSRILVTTRLSNVADSFCSCTPQELHFLDDDKSWTLFHDKVFGKESCPPKLEEVGKTIVRNCRGLPLAVVAISGLLAKSSGTVEYWEFVANDTSAALNMGGDGLCYEVLSLSYKHLPVYLKPCFLYMAIFPADHKIRISRLVKLWIGEGILKPTRSRSLEEIAEDYLKDLIERNLIMIHEYGSRNKMKTCTIHDLLRDLCLREAAKEKFLCVTMKHSLNEHIRIINDERVLMFTRSSKKVELESKFEKRGVQKMFHVCSREKMVRFVNSRYIDFTHEMFENLLHTIKSVSLLWNLQTVTISGATPITLPAEIWEMPQLRHLIRKEGSFELSGPPSTKSKNGRRDIIVLKNLQTLSRMWKFRCTDEVVHRMPNLRKLGITFDFSFGWDCYEVNNFSHLCNLESLLLGRIDKNLLQNLRFPCSLKKLVLERCAACWEDLTVVGSLPHLEVLYLKFVKGREWNPMEGQFLGLKSLRIEHTKLAEWVADSSHFPCLEKLKLVFLRYLKEIPYGIGEIHTLRSISIEFCSHSANTSANKIKEEQRNLGNYDLHVRVLSFTL
ncbi:putative late blight resistance protein homolog R1C-3 [Henckelia pumila]|uniref:putative late blight resistance protein homolog R1C-3 n=1 Tax=Henckelia pumila TaxID=405737 RepID=UPI003C6E00D1